MNQFRMALGWNFGLNRAIATGSFIAISAAVTLPAQAQLIPQPWVSVGAKDAEISYSVGARWLDFGAELGTGTQGATGVDALKFVSLPVISPYVGLGLYSGKDSVAYSGGVQVNLPDRLVLGVGYHSIRGINGQIGIRF
jgi:hypothetical protein